MWIILGLLTLGCLAGILLSGYNKFNPFTEKITGYVIYLLLFFMGLSVGVNPEIMSNLHGLGTQALLLAVFSIAGSILAAFFVGKWLFREAAGQTNRNISKK